MNNNDLFRKSNTITKDRRRFPVLSEEKKAAILATRTPTRCPPVYVAVTFRQAACKGEFA